MLGEKKTNYCCAQSSKVTGTRGVVLIDYFNPSSFFPAQCLKITEKSIIQHCERSELGLHFEWTKVN